MSANNRRNKREQYHSCIDYQACNEAESISQAFTSKTIDFGKRLNKYYYCDGQRFNTGKKHRRQAVGASVRKSDRKAKVRKPHKSRHIDLASINAHKRIETGKKAYDVLNVKKIQNIMMYRTGLIRPTNSQI